MERMKAVVCDRYGLPDLLRVAEIDQPSVPDDGVLVRVHASSVNPVDFFSLSGAKYAARVLAGRLKPKLEVLGIDFAGTVEAVGRTVTRFQPGDEVFGGRPGAFAEYVCLPENGPVVRKPLNVSFEMAAAVPVAAITALQAMRDHGQMQPGQKVLINGASGGVGTFAVQIARAFGAHITAVCGPRNSDAVRSMGADRVIDYTEEDFTRSGERLRPVAGHRRESLLVGVHARTGAPRHAGRGRRFGKHRIWCRADAEASRRFTSRFTRWESERSFLYHQAESGGPGGTARVARDGQGGAGG